MSLAVPAVLLVFWEICSRHAIVSPRYFPPPTTVGWALVDGFAAGDLGTQALVTLTRLGFAFAIAAGPGVMLGLLMGMARPVRDAVEPYIAFIFPVPKITLLPFLLIILGVGEPAFVLTGATSAFFQIVISTLGGVQTMDPRLLDVGRNYGATIFHPSGTCKMGNDPMAVVDERLRVRGIAGLRVVDCSIMPVLVSGNTHAPAVMIAEKASDLILEDAR